MSCFLAFWSTWRYQDFTYVYQKLQSDEVWFLRYLCDRQTDGWTYRGGCPALLSIRNSPYKVFQLECLILFIIEIIIILNQISAWSFFYKKHVASFLSLLKKKKELCHIKWFLCSSGISMGRYCRKILTKSGEFKKKIKKRGGHIVGVEDQTFCTLCTKMVQNKTLW